MNDNIKKESNISEPETTLPLKGKYYYGTGSRKRSVARVRLYDGKGLVYVNSKPVSDKNDSYLEPFTLVGKTNKFDLSIVVKGGGKISQIEAIRHGISRALVEYNDEFKSTLRKAGFLTRDPREKERKKPGLKRARRAPQWQKR